MFFNRKCLCAIAILCVFQVHRVMSGATEEQMQATAKLMRDVCLPRFPKVTEEMADKIRSGTILDDTDSKCYINCVLEMMQMMKKGKFMHDAAVKQVELLMPDNYKDEYRGGMAACRTAAKGIKNHCDAGHALLICFRENMKRFLFA